MGKSFVPGSTVPVIPGMSSGVGKLAPLIPFNIIVETDIGLLALIYKEYMDEDVFDKEYLDTTSFRQLVLDLYNRDHENPLSICIRDEYKDSMEDFYHQFMEREYDKILEMSAITEFYRLIGRFNRDPDIHPIVYCERPEEVDVLKENKNTADCHIIMADEINPGFINSMEQFYFKSLRDTIPFVKHMKKKSVYIAAYGFNLSKKNNGLIEDPLVPLLIKHNSVYMIDVFNTQKLRGE